MMLSTRFIPKIGINTRTLQRFYNGPVTTYPHRNQEIGIISTSCDKGQPITGTKEGPLLLFNSGLDQQLQTLGYSTSVSTLHSVPTPSTVQDPTFKDSKGIGQLNYLIYKNTMLSLKNNQIPLNLTSNHAYGVGPLLAQLQFNPETKVVWVDAHADINPKGSSPSGNIHGMSVDICMNLKRYAEEPGWNWLGSLPNHAELKPHNLAYLGLSSVDLEERNIIDQNNIFAADVHTLRQESLLVTFQKMQEYFHSSANHMLPHEYHLQWDIDVSSAFTSTGTREEIGLTTPEVMSLANLFFKSRTVSSIVMTEFNPQIGTPEDVSETKKLTLQLIRTLFGETLLHQRGGLLTPRPR